MTARRPAPRVGARGRGRAAPAIAALIAAAGLAFVALDARGPAGPSLAVFDAFQRLAPRTWDADMPVRVVAIDRESLARYGQWPWPRPHLAALIDRLQGAGALAIGIDVVFAEPDRTSPEVAAAASRRLEPGAAPPRARAGATENDRALARRIAEAPVALAALPVAEGGAPGMTGPYGIAAVGADPREGMIRFAGVETPLPELAAAAPGLGLAGLGDGTGAVVRRQPLFARVGEDIAPSLAAEVLRVAFGARSHLLRSADTAEDGAVGLRDARIGPLEVPLSADGAFWLRYAGPQPRRVVPAWRVLEGTEAELGAAFGDRLVLVGATAPGLRYLAATPLSAATDGVEIQAEILEQLLAGAHLRRPDWAAGAEALAALIAAAAVLALAAGRGLATGALGTAAVIAAAGGAAWLGFVKHGLLLSPAAPAAVAAAGFVAFTALNLLRASAHGRLVRAQFERFVAPPVITRLIEDPDSTARLAAEERMLTLMFVDVRGFTTLSETMPPERLIPYLNELLAALSDCILARGGTVDKYLGDGLMAFWGAPLEDPEHARRALETIWAIRDARDRLNAGFAARGLPEVRLGVGVNSGRCSVGLIGSQRRLDYSCIGDAVNLAARLESMTKGYGVFNCVGPDTLALAPGWPAAAIDRRAARGRTQVADILFALDPRDPETPGLAALIAAARAGDAAALARLATVATADLDGATLAAALRGSP